MMTLIIMRRCKNNASVSRQLCKFLQEREENRVPLMMIYTYYIIMKCLFVCLSVITCVKTRFEMCFEMFQNFLTSKRCDGCVTGMNLSPVYV